MLGKKHEVLMKDIQGSGKNLGIIPVLEKGNFLVKSGYVEILLNAKLRSVNFFIEDSYKDESEKEHKYVLRCIDGAKEVVGIKETLESAGLHSQNYFIESSYKAGTRNYKCYLVTRMGCELLGNKHKKLLRDIKKYADTLNGANFGLVDFFIESTYLDAYKRD